MNRYLRDLRILAGFGAFAALAVAVLAVRALVQEPNVLSLVVGVFFATLATLGLWFAVRAHVPPARDGLRAALRAGLVLGGIAFAGGFVGPMLVSPDANQGPLLGIFLTGPLGFVVGVLGGLAWRRLPHARMGSGELDVLVGHPCDPRILENRTDGPTGDLNDEFLSLQSRWLSGARDRETALRLLFLSWYSCSEPQWLSGLTMVSDPGAIFREHFEFLGGEASEDEEFLFVAGYMATLFPWCIGPEGEWKQKGERCLQRRRRLSGSPLDPAVFEGRGEYGRYFAHIARGGWCGL